VTSKSRLFKMADISMEHAVAKPRLLEFTFPERRRGSFKRAAMAPPPTPL